MVYFKSFFFIFRPIAVGALLTTVIACVCVVIQALIDHRNNTEGYLTGTPKAVDYPAPTTIGVIKAFSTIMFAFAGASTFPTIQADMKHKHQFKYSAIIACTSKCTANIFNVIFTVFKCVRLYTVISLYGLRLIAAPSTVE